MHRNLVVFLSIALLGGSLSAQNKTVVLTSLEWPPYTSASLKGGGASAVVATEAFKAMGYQLKISFFPWARAVALAQDDSKYAGYFPEYDSVENRSQFLYSQPMGTSPLGFVERKADPVAWTTLADLKTKTVGVVAGYINTEEFDAMVAKNTLKVDPAPDDTTNVVKVAVGRIPLAVIDQNVLSYLTANDKVAIPYRSVVQINSRLLELKKLYVCFKKGPEGEAWSKIFSDGLKKINVDAVFKEALAAQAR